MKKEIKIDLATIFFWIALIMLILVIAWRIFGHSPQLGALSTALAFFGVVLTWYFSKLNIRALKPIEQKLEKLESLNAQQLDRLQKIVQLLEKWQPTLS